MRAIENPVTLSVNCPSLHNVSRESFSVLIPDGESGSTILVLRCFSRVPAIRPHVLSTDRWAVARFSRYRSRFINRRIGDVERVAAICETAKQLNVDVILPVDEPIIRALSIHRDAVSRIAAIAPMPETAAFDIAMNKWSFAELLATSGLPHPPTIVYRRDGDNDGFVERLSALRFPVVSKPVVGAGGAGIRLFHDPSATIEHLRDSAGSGHVIIQSFIKGYDIDCSVLCRDGEILAYTIQKGFIGGQQQFACSRGIEFLREEKVYAVASQLVRALRWSGVAHIDMRYDEEDGKLKVLELNPRYWRTLLGSLCAGVSFPYLACLTGLGIEFPQPAYQSIRYVEGKAAFRILTQRDRHTGKAGFLHDRSSIEFVLRDPLPYLFVNCKELGNRVMRKVRKNQRTSPTMLFNTAADVSP